MDELLKNYIKHIQVNFSSDLADELNEIYNNALQSNIPIEDIESSLQNKLINYFQNLKLNEFEKTAKNLYEAYVDYDDGNLIRSVSFLTRIYSKFLNLKLAKFFCNWRIKAVNITNNEKLKKINIDKTQNESVTSKNNYNFNINNKEIHKDYNNTYKTDQHSEMNDKEIYFNKNKMDANRSKNKFNNNNYSKNMRDNQESNKNFNYFYNSENIIYDQNNDNNCVQNNVFSDEPETYPNKLLYNYNYDPRSNSFENSTNYALSNNQHNQEAYEKVKKLEQKNVNLDINSEDSNQNYILHNKQSNGFRTQRNKNEEENKIWSKNKTNNSFIENKNTSYANNSPANSRSKDRNDNKINRDEKRMLNKLEKQRKEKSNLNSMSIFDKLFLESYKKSDEKLLNEEIKKISELDECTFQPNVNKKGII